LSKLCTSAATPPPGWQLALTKKCLLERKRALPFDKLEPLVLDDSHLLFMCQSEAHHRYSMPHAHIYTGEAINWPTHHQTWKHCMNGF